MIQNKLISPCFIFLDGRLIPHCGGQEFFLLRFLTVKPQRRSPITMISVLAQERLLGAALGSVFSGIVVFNQRQSIYSLISENQIEPEAHLQQIREPVLGKKTNSELAHLWNKSVDQTIVPVIASLSSGGW